ncbi:sugar-binding transcriptional regulator [Pseudalkalibacillus caeni]|uniref:Sugar-binding transcriptional regulator n=1 Tax=Exobacillus caeni TaxID=2574798 RepID=A0A5R9F5Q4_9BACL|nr:sugar-binding transcriptional regulator [Pseudalkalibacillus caeni]TLS38371.1 sugar-binding transcriptional regulator [Pseudalkalibacillus caeni]
MAILEDRRLLVKIAHMYYEERATQSQIAAKIGVSRSLISKYLAKARDQGIVEIIIHEDDDQKYRKLESKIEQQYGLREVICIDSVEYESSKIRLGNAASQYLLRVIKENQIVGISSGTTLNEVSKAVSTNQEFPSVTFVPLVGGVGNERVDIHSNYLVARFGEELKSNYELLHVPVIVDSKEAKEVMMRQPSIQKVFRMAENSDIAIVGIGGTPEHSTMVKSYLGTEKEDLFKAQEVVGDICYNFIDKDGNATNSPWNERVMALDLVKLKKIPLVIGVASGSEKVQAIKAALKGELVDVLITDEATGIALTE